jgi:hypothetical protein
LQQVSIRLAGSNAPNKPCAGYDGLRLPDIGANQPRWKVQCQCVTGVKLMDQLRAVVVEAVAILELQELEGRKKLPNTPLHALAVVSEYGE